MRAATAVTNGDLARGRELLDACPTELRGWEWKRLDWLATPKMLLMLQGQEQPLFTPDGKSLVSACMGADQNTVKVWNLETGEARITLRGHTQRVTSVALSPNGKRIVSCDMGGVLKLWDMDSEQALWSIPAHTTRSDGLAFSPDGTRIASVSWDRTLKLFAAEDAKEIASKELARRLRSVAFSPEGDRIVTAVHYREPDGDAQVWEVAEGKELEPLFSLRGHDGTTTMAAFSPDGQRIVTSSNDGTLKIWQAAARDEVSRPSRGQAPPASGAPLARGTPASSEAPWTPLLTLRGHSDRVHAVAFSPDGRRIASGGHDQTVRLWEIATGRLMTVFTGHTGTVFWLSFRGDGKRLASFGYPRDGIRVWDTDVEPDEFSLPTAARAFAFHPRGTSVATGGSDGTIKVWDIASGRQLRTLYGHRGPVRSLAYSSDGRSLVSGIGAWTLVWDPATGTLRRTLDGREYSVQSVAFSPDGGLIVSGSSGEDGAVRLWDSKTGKAVAASFDHMGAVRAVAFSPDGAQIASGSADRTLRLWDVETRVARSLDQAPAALLGVCLSNEKRIH